MRNILKAFLSILIMLSVIMFYATSSIAFTLPLSMVAQNNTMWCWAACIQAIENYYGNSAIRQCDMAKYFEIHHNPNWYSTTDCCDYTPPNPAGFPPTIDYCNQVNYFIATDKGTPNVQQIMSQMFGTQTTGLPRALTSVEFQNEIFAAKPFMINWQPNSGVGSGHALVGCGTSGNNNMLYMDPFLNSGQIQYEPYAWIVLNDTYYWAETIKIVKPPDVPIASLTVNGKKGNVSISSTQYSSLTIDLNPSNKFYNFPADWWIIVVINNIPYYCTTSGWTSAATPYAEYNLMTYHWDLFLGKLPTGTNVTFYFGVDLTQNQILDQPLFYDFLTLTVY